VPEDFVLVLEGASRLLARGEGERKVERVSEHVDDDDDDDNEETKEDDNKGA
jgi:hypothetical protein